MRRTVAALLLLVTFGFALRICLLGYQELRGDEGFTWNYIQGSPSTIVNRIIQEGDPQPPLHYWLEWGWTQFAGDSEFALRFPSVFLSVMLIPLMYQVGKKLWQPAAGLLAAFITTIHPQQLWLAQDARNMYLLALAALLIGAYLLPSLLQPMKAKRTWTYMACGLFALYSHYYSLFVLIAHTGYVLALRPGRQVWRWFRAGIVIGLGFAPWALIVMPLYLHGQLAAPGTLPATQYAMQVFGEAIAGPSFPTATQTAASVLIGLVALLPFFTAYPWKGYLAGWLVVPLIGIYAITRLRATFNAYYFFVAFPAIYFLIALGLLRILHHSRRLGLVLLGALTVLYAVGAYNHYFDARYSKTRGLREAAQYIAQARQPGDGFLANFPDPTEDYYLRQLNLPHNMLPTAKDFVPAEVDTALQQLNYQRIWFVPMKASQWDADGYVQTRLLSTNLLLDDQRFRQIRLMLFTSPDRASPLDGQFADHISLVGYAVAPGRVTLLWRASAALATNYTVFVHALTAEGVLVAQHDAQPTVLTSQWQPGQLILDVHELTLPADRPLTLTAGLYQPATGQRLTSFAPPTLEPNAVLITVLASK